jgi:uncharacterized protein YndB with AHSA1/START domain
MTIVAAAVPVPKRNSTIMRNFASPPDRVFRSWTDPRQMAQWWGPDGFTTRLCEIDLRPGGALWIVAHAPDGSGHAIVGEFYEVEPPRRLVLTNVQVDDDGNPLLESVITVIFAGGSAFTQMTLQTSTVLVADDATAILAGMPDAWRQRMNRLAERLSSV